MLLASRKTSHKTHTHTNVRAQTQTTHNLFRTKQVVHEGKVGSLRRIKEDVEEVSEGVECGLSAEGYADWKEVCMMDDSNVH